MRVRQMAVLGAVAVFCSMFGSAALAEDTETMIEIPIQEVYVSGDVGSSVAMGSADVAGDLVGRSCNVVATVTNQDSVHPGNTLVVSSGDSSVSIADIEDVADAVTTQGGTITLGDTISAAVVLGADGATSLGSSLTVTCDALPETEPTPPTPASPVYTG
ncbi:MAG: hypothetical protein OEW83_21580 [Acidimicrobiia bacterium]|nr:hypothetical protein [Acidimicrobiia bacterium]